MWGQVDERDIMTVRARRYAGKLEDEIVLAASGANLVLAGRDATRLAGGAKPIDAHVITCDATRFDGAVVLLSEDEVEDAWSALMEQAG